MHLDSSPPPSLPRHRLRSWVPLGVLMWVASLLLSNIIKIIIIDEKKNNNNVRNFLHIPPPSRTRRTMKRTWMLAGFQNHRLFFRWITISICFLTDFFLPSPRAALPYPSPSVMGEPPGRTPILVFLTWLKIIFNKNIIARFFPWSLNTERGSQPAGHRVCCSQLEACDDL